MKTKVKSTSISPAAFALAIVVILACSIVYSGAVKGAYAAYFGELATASSQLTAAATEYVANGTVWGNKNSPLAAGTKTWSHGSKGSDLPLAAGNCVYYRFQLSSAAKISVYLDSAYCTMTTNCKDVELALCVDPSGTEKSFSEFQSATPTPKASNEYQCYAWSARLAKRTSGYYYIRVTAPAKSDISYFKFHVDVTYGECNGCEKEDNASQSAATSVSASGITYTFIGDSYSMSDVDYFKFNVPSKGTLRMKVETRHPYLSSTTKTESGDEHTHMMQLDSATAVANNNSYGYTYPYHNVQVGTHYLRVRPMTSADKAATGYTPALKPFADEYVITFTFVPEKENTLINTVNNAYTLTGFTTSSQTLKLPGGRLSYQSTDRHVIVVYNRIRNFTPNSARYSYVFRNLKIAKNFTGVAKVKVTASAVEGNQYIDPIAAASKTIRIIVKPGKMKAKEVKNVKGKKIKAIWSKMAGADKYQVQVALDKKLKKGKKTYSAKGSAASKTTGKLKKGKTYYVRIRVYDTQTKSWGAWSALKKVKVKK